MRVYGVVCPVRVCEHFCFPQALCRQRRASSSSLVVALAQKGVESLS